MPEHVNQASTSNSAGSSRVFVMPSGPAPIAGQLLLAFVSGGSTIQNDTATGGPGQTWSKVGAVANNGGNEYIQGWKTTAIGGGADALTLSGSFENRMGWVVCARGWDGNLGNIGYNKATTSTLNPPALNMGASRDHLFYAFARNNSNAITGGPAGYTFLGEQAASSSRIAVAHRAVTTQTEDPGAFSGTVNAAVAGVVGVRPGSFGFPPATSAAMLAYF